MNTVCVETKTKYTVYIQENILSHAGEYLCKLSKGNKIAIISDSNVFPFYGRALSDHLHQSDFSVYSFIFPAGEESKSTKTYVDILNFLAENGFSRSDLLIALGGGVVGDITGFTAATYMRGINYVQIPTTLLAMVDSSVGGKTAIDLPAGKNLVGCFYQPVCVLCDPLVLQTLPNTVFRDGCAEVIKYGVLFDSELLDHLTDRGMDFDRESVITKCICLKRDIVSADEFDRGCRQLLNLGHTIGHSIEAQSQFQISHGQAVAMGMAIIAKAAQARKMCDPCLYERICACLQRFSLPCNTTYSANSIYEFALSDKKRQGKTLNLIIPQKIGHCSIVPINTEDLKSFIEAGL